MFRCLAVVIAATACSAYAVEVDGIAKEHRPIVVTHESGVQINVLYWDNGEPKLLTDDHLIRLDDRTIWSAPSGTYAVIQQGSAIVQVTADGSPRPSPTPGPKPEPPKPDPPDPGPTPGPQIEIKWAVWIYEQTDAIEQIEQTNVRQSIETRQYLDSQGIKFAAYDDDQDAAKAKPFRSVAGKLPALVLMQNANTFTVHPAPVSFDDLKKLVKEVSGE